MTSLPTYLVASTEKKASLSDEAYRYIQEKIVTYAFPPHSILNEVEIASALGISRTPVREAIKQLGVDGLVCLKPNLGAEVIGLDSEEMANILQIRAFLEGLCAKRAATTLDSNQIQLLHEAIDLQQFYYERNELAQCWKAGNTFHYIIYSNCSGNQIGALLRTYHTYIYLWLNKHILALSDRHPSESLRAHKSILAAIEAHDGKASQDLMAAHLHRTIDSIQLPPSQS